MKRMACAKFLVLIGCAALIYLFPGCTQMRTGIYVEGHSEPKAPPPQAPAHGYRAKHKYHYYPSAQVYFDISREVYFYLEGGRWQISVSLPRRFHIDVVNYVNIEMKSARPYEAFDKHKKKYPPGYKKEKKKKKKKKEWVYK